MTTFLDGYKLIGYDSDGTTVLTPVAGAPHSQPFQFSSIGGVAGLPLSVSAAVNGTGGGNRGFDGSFTGASAVGFTASDAADQGYGYFPVAIKAGGRYRVVATMAMTNGVVLRFITSTGLNFATDLVQVVQDTPVTGVAYEFTASADAAYVGIAAAWTSGTMQMVVSGFLIERLCTPALDPNVTGRKTTYNHKTRKLTIGQLVVTVDDQRVTVGGSDADRFVTAFLGDLQGVPRMLGKKMVLYDTVDGGANWTLFGTYLVDGVKKASRRKIQLVLRELGEELKAQCFVGAPHASLTYVKPLRLWPVTPNNVTYGPWTSTIKRIRVKASRILGGAGAIVAPQVLDPGDIITKALVDRVHLNSMLTATPSATDLVPRRKVRARVAWATGSLAGQTKDYWVGSLNAVGLTANNGKSILNNCALVPVAATDPNYGALPATNDLGDMELLGADSPSPECPLYIDSVTFKQLAEDLCAGKLYYLNDDGTVTRTWPCDTTAIPNDLPISRWTITGPWKMDAFFEAACLEFGLGMRRTAAGVLQFFDARMPTSLAGIVTLTNADLFTTVPDWTHDREGAITWLEIKSYTDVQVADAEVQKNADLYPDFAPSRIRSVQNTLILAKFGAGDLGEHPFSIDCQGLRATSIDTDVVNGRQRLAWLNGVLDDLARQFQRPYGAGPMRTTLRARRTANVLSLLGGSLALIQESSMPDPKTNRRGGTRLVRLEEVSRDGLAMGLAIVDLGTSAGSSSPTFGTPAKDGGNPMHGITLGITLGAEGDPVVVQAAVTDTSVGSAPAVDSPLWTQFGIARSNGTATLTPYPSGKRIWIRGRSESDGRAKEPRVPSAWVSPTPAFIDLDPYPAPTAGGYSNATGTTAVLTWTNADATRRIEIRTDAGVRLANGLAPAGTTKFRATGLTFNATQNLKVRYVDDLGGVGTDLVIAVTTTAVTPVAPTPRGLRVVPGSA